jgi:hypothetical protein
MNTGVEVVTSIVPNLQNGAEGSAQQIQLFPGEVVNAPA